MKGEEQQQEKLNLQPSDRHQIPAIIIGYDKQEQRNREDIIVSTKLEPQVGFRWFPAPTIDRQTNIPVCIRENVLSKLNWQQELPV